MTPVKPGAHSHVNISNPLTHVDPAAQGEVEHSLMSERSRTFANIFIEIYRINHCSNCTLAESVVQELEASGTVARERACTV